MKAMRLHRLPTTAVIAVLVAVQLVWGQQDRQARAVVIPCKGMIDDGLYRSIHRRTQAAVKSGADYLIYQLQTYGGLVDAADNIAKFLILDASKQARTVAYISTEAISAGAMIAVSCQDIIMRAHTTIGDCAPIALGQKLEGVEREKTESFIRAAFDRAAKANDYPVALLRAMVTMEIEVYRVKDRDSGQYVFFEAHQMPKDPNRYDIEGAELVDTNDRILTLDAESAHNYGISRAVVEDINGVVAFLEQRDGISIARPLDVLRTTWSEEMVRTLNRPVVSGLLLTVALIAIYIELSTPGIGLPGLVAVICLAILGGSKYMTGLANWLEVLLVIAGLILLLVELFVLPGFGIAGVTGIAFVMAGLFGMLVKNPPDRLPWPQSPWDWQVFTQGALGLIIGIGGFAIFVLVAAKYLPRWRVFGGLVLIPSAQAEVPQQMETLAHTRPGQVVPSVGDKGLVEATLRPAGKVRFGQALVDCVTRGQFLAPGTQVVVTEVHGGRVVVEPVRTEVAGP